MDELVRVALKWTFTSSGCREKGILARGNTHGSACQTHDSSLDFQVVVVVRDVLESQRAKAVIDDTAMEWDCRGGSGSSPLESPSTRLILAPRRK